MDIAHEIALRLGSLPADKQQEVFDFVEFLRARANVTADDNAQPLRGILVMYVDPTEPVAAEDWDAAR